MGLSPLDRFGVGSQIQQFGYPAADHFSQRQSQFGAPSMLDEYIGFREPEQIDTVNRWLESTSPNEGNRYTGQSFGIESEIGNRFTDRFNQGFGDTQSPSNYPQASYGSVGTVGGSWAALDAHNPEISAAAAKYGVPANLLKSMINRESSGNWARDNRVHEGFRDQRMLPFVGIFESTADSWGLDFNSMIGNKQAQIDGMAKILSGLSQQYGGYENAAYVYFGGPQALNGNFRDELGMDSDTYGRQAINDWRMLDQKAGFTTGFGDGGVGTGIVQAAMQYVGVPYVWGSLPGADKDPWKTGWDCSAFVNWLDDKYGANEIPAGSHYQYQDSVDKGLLFTDMNQLKPGDLIFWDTGNTAGGGANLNRAGHVSMYIGNGQMIHAANPNAGTIISNVSDYMNMYPTLGARHMGWSAAGQAQMQPVSGMPVFSNVFQKYLRKAA